MKLYQLLAFLPFVLGSVSAAEPWVSTPSLALPALSRCETPATSRLLPNEARYQICADQIALFNEALARARASKRLLLVEFGATWCPSCRSLQKQVTSSEILGFVGEGLDYAATFELVEIGVSTVQSGRMTDVPSGHAVLTDVLARTNGAKMKSVPFLAVIDPSGSDRVVTRNLDDLEQTAGGHRAEGIRSFLRQAHAHIRGTGAAPSEPGWFAQKFNRGWQRAFGG